MGEGGENRVIGDWFLIFTDQTRHNGGAKLKVSSCNS